MSDFDTILDDDSDLDHEAEPVAAPSEPSEPVEAVAESPAPEQTDTSETAPVAEEAQPITRDDGAVWSENAKRWYKDGKIVAGEAPTIEPSNPSTPPVVAEQPVIEQPPAPIGEPWTVRGGGGKHTIPGAFVTPEGKLVVEPEGQAQLKALIAAGIQHNQNYPKERQQYQQQIKMAEERGKAEGQKYNQAAVLLWDHLANPEWLQAAVQNPEYIDLLRSKLDLTLQKASLAIPQQPTPQESQEITPEVFGSALSSALDELIEDAPKGLLSAEDVAEMKQAYARRMNAYAAEQDGEIVLDFHAVRDDFARDLKMYQRAQQQSAQAIAAAQKAKAAAAFNQQQTGKPAIPAPTKPKPKPALAAAPSGTKAKSWDQRVKDAWDDTDDEE